MLAKRKRARVDVYNATRRHLNDLPDKDRHVFPYDLAYPVSQLCDHDDG
jgi:hypothetical protein